MTATQQLTQMPDHVLLKAIDDSYSDKAKYGVDPQCATHPDLILSWRLPLNVYF